MFNNLNILTIDDSFTIRNYLRNVFTPLGASVEGVGSGEEGLAQCAQKEYDLILLDLMLPDIGGIEVLQRLREKNETSAVVMLTGTGGIKSAIAAVHQGADGYLEKQDVVSGDTTEFFYTLEQALKRRAGLVAQKQLLKIKTDFYSMVTHDLRSPTGDILQATDMLLNEELGPLLPEQHEIISMTQLAAQKLLGLINNYLDFAKIDSGYLRLHRERWELRDLVESSARLARLQAHAKHQTLTLDLPSEPVFAVVDAERLKQVIDNLIHNAIKYTPKGGSVTVQLKAQDGQAVLQVSDTGNGIPPNQLPALFTKYHRVPGEVTRGIQGTGLGLLIVKEIVEAHGGNVRAESEGVPGKGATFIASLPLAEEE